MCSLGQKKVFAIVYVIVFPHIMNLAIIILQTDHEVLPDTFRACVSKGDSDL